jgi:hypothetical protein
MSGSDSDSASHDEGVLELDFRGKTYTIQKTSLTTFLTSHTDFQTARSYSVRAQVKHDVFEHFFRFLNTGAQLYISPDNADPLKELADEFSLPDLAAHCRAISIWAGQISQLRALVDDVERRTPNVSTRVQESMAVIQTGDVSDLNSGVETLTTDMGQVRRQLDKLTTQITDVIGPMVAFHQRRLECLRLENEPYPLPLRSCQDDLPIPKSAAPIARTQQEVDVTTHRDDGGGGVLALLSRKCHGNAHTEGLITVTSKSISTDTRLPTPALWSDLNDCRPFVSEDAPDQWICWDFREMRLALVQYRITDTTMKTWVVEGSEDGETWTTIDQQRDNPLSDNPVSCPVSPPISRRFRFIRLTQQGKSADGNDVLTLGQIEFFGKLLD